MKEEPHNSQSVLEKEKESQTTRTTLIAARATLQQRKLKHLKLLLLHVGEKSKRERNKKKQ